MTSTTCSPLPGQACARVNTCHCAIPSLHGTLVVFEMRPVVWHDFANAGQVLIRRMEVVPWGAVRPSNGIRPSVAVCYDPDKMLVVHARAYDPERLDANADPVDSNDSCFMCRRISLPALGSHVVLGVALWHRCPG